MSAVLAERVILETEAKYRHLYAVADTTPRWQPRPEQVPPPGDWRVWLIMAGRGWGKTRTGAEWTIASARDYPLTNIIGATADDARDIMIEGEALALDTPIPSPDGWRVMGELMAGDRIFDERGIPRKITWTSPVAHDRPCYRVIFSDGEEIVADAQHKWVTHTRAARQYGKEGSVVTTEEIAATLMKHGWNNHAIPLAGPVAYPERDLPIDPYVLGAWLGDGRNRGGDFTSEDEAIPDLLRACGYEVHKHSSRYAYRICKIDPALHNLGVIDNKHIPAEYFEASAQQRLSLLQGLMDTDGYVSERGQCAFDGNNLRLVADVRALVRSLGMSCSTKATKKIHARYPDAAPMLRITFTPTLPVFRLDRKVVRLRPLSKKASWRMIVAVEPCESVPVMCITVDSPTHLYLAGRGYVPTHNSGILASAPAAFRPRYLPSKRRLEWPNGAKTLIFTADEPERLRGKQHMRLWADEVAAWRHADAWDQAMFGLRLGADPRAIATTTPKPRKIIRDLLAQIPAGRVAKTTGTTYDNRANLAPAFFEQIITRYEGTRLGRQELGGEYLDDTPGALWTRGMFDARRPAPDLARVVVAIDIATTSNDDSDETGIVVVGKGADGRGYVLADRSCKLSPDGWAKRAWAAFDEFKADRIVYESNQGGDLIATVLRTVRRDGPLTAVHASRGKRTRAEPVAALYEQGKVTHPTPLDDLEDQLCTWSPDDGDSPDRLDALVWGLTEVMLQARGWSFT